MEDDNSGVEDDNSGAGDDNSGEICDLMAKGDGTELGGCVSCLLCEDVRAKIGWKLNVIIVNKWIMGTKLWVKCRLSEKNVVFSQKN